MPQKALLELVNRYNKVTGFKINIQKPDVFLYTNNKLSNKTK